MDCSTSSSLRNGLIKPSSLSAPDPDANNSGPSNPTEGARNRLSAENESDDAECERLRAFLPLLLAPPTAVVLPSPAPASVEVLPLLELG